MAKPQKVELPADLTQQFPIPEDATVADLDAMIRQITADAEKMLGDKSANVEGATWLMDTVDQINARKGELVAVEQERQAQIDAARERINANKPGDGEGGDETGSESGDDDEDEEHRDGDKPGDGEGGQHQNGDAAGTVADAPGAPALVASSAVQRRRSAIGAAASAQGGTKLPVAPTKTRDAYLTAAAEVPGFTPGQKVGWGEIGLAAEKRFTSLPNPMNAGGGRVQLSIGSVHVDSDPGLVASGRGDVASADEAIKWALSSKRLQQETGADSLLAAGGWCAPSETLYDLVDLSTQDGLLDIPGITVNRGGVRFSLGPDFAAVYNAGANFTKTEAQAIAGSAKPVVNVPCPTFADHRMVVDGLYLTGDILSQKGYPEAYADYTQKSLTAFAHYVNAQTIADLETNSTQVTMTSADTGSPAFYDAQSGSLNLLGACELQIIDMRYRNRLSLTNSVELVLPLWAKGVIRSDLSRRAAVASPADISDAQIDAFFAQRGAAVQWVYDWQDAFTGVTAGFGASTPILAYPQTVKFLIYPQGTFVRALSDVIELNAVYDSTLLTTNQFVHLFMEQARLTLKRAWDAREVTVNVPITGATGAGVNYTTMQPTF